MSAMQVSRTIPTDLAGHKNNEILHSIIGQMSDGMWENSNQERYWLFCDIDSDNNILIDDRYRSWCKRFYSSGFASKSDNDVARFFARKLKKICKQFLEDDGHDPIRDWNRKSDIVCSYLGYDEFVTIADAYKAYDKLMGTRHPKYMEVL